jgi:hypothetical protein
VSVHNETGVQQTGSVSVERPAKVIDEFQFDLAPHESRKGAYTVNDIYGSGILSVTIHFQNGTTLQHTVMSNYHMIDLGDRVKFADATAD